MPINPIMNGGGPAPVEGDDEGYWTGMQGALRSGVERTLGYTFIRANINSGPQVSQADAMARLKQENYDSSGVPAEGLSAGALNERMERASAIRQGNDLAARAHLGGASQFVAGVAAQIGDPLNVVLAPLASLAPLRAGLAGRSALGAVEGAGFTAAYEKGQNAIGRSMGDPDITSQQMLRDMMFGAGVGAVLHGAFGPRPLAPMNGGSVTLDMIDRLGERTVNYSKATGIPVDQAVSRAGAIGRYQVEPATAAQYLGMNGKDSVVIAGLRARLRNPEFNKMVAGKIVDDLNTKFKGDPEAVAIAYNAGPGAARKFIRAGRDYSVLREETRQYAARVAGLPRSVRIDAAKMAIGHTEIDSKIDVAPVIDSAMSEHFKTNAFKVADEHADDVTKLETEAFQRAAPKRDSMFTEDDSVKQAQSKIDNKIEAAQPKEPAVGQPVAIDLELSQHVTNDVQEAKSMQEKLGVAPGATETQKAAAQFEEPEPHMIDGLPAQDHQKAVEAAVRCGLLKGGFA